MCCAKGKACARVYVNESEGGDIASMVVVVVHRLGRF